MLDNFLSGIRNRPHFRLDRQLESPIAPDKPGSHQAIREYTRVSSHVKPAFLGFNNPCGNPQNAARGAEWMARAPIS